MWKFEPPAASFQSPVAEFLTELEAQIRTDPYLQGAFEQERADKVR